MLNNLRRSIRLVIWRLSECPLPPPHYYKQITIERYANKFNINKLIETGTYMGDMINAMKYKFKSIISIELSQELHKQAVKKFVHYKNVKIINGDSAAVLPQVLDETSEKTIFWLDGHYSGGITACGSVETPILDELNAILKHRIDEHVILIDDARCFGDEIASYPTIKEIRELVKSYDDQYIVLNKNDIIRIYKEKMK